MDSSLLRARVRAFRVGTLLPALALALTPGHARAQSAVLLDVQALAILVSSVSFCVTYTYDKNGNRISQVTANVGSAGANWGTGKFGCFVWHS